MSPSGTVASVGRWVTIALAAIAVLTLSACDPVPPSGRPDGVDINVTINTDGSGTADVYLDNSFRSSAELRAVGQAVGLRMFPDATSVTVDIDPNGYGYPFVVIDAQGLYEPGPRPQVSLDTREAVTWLLANGTKTVDVVVFRPQVPSTSTWTPSAGEGEYSWDWMRITNGAAAPVGVVVMAPKPWLGVLPGLLIVLAIGLLIGSVVVFRGRRRRALAMLLAGAALVASAVDGYVVAVSFSSPFLPTNLGVAGVASTPWEQVFVGLMLLYLLTAPTAVVLLIVYATVRPPRPIQVFVAPPGWPPPPYGWTPPPGWQPDPSWPPAPYGWRFWREASEQSRTPSV